MNKWNMVVIVGVLVLGFSVGPIWAKADQSSLQLLMAGNQRFVSGNVIHPHQDAQRKKEAIQGQKPIAVILTCSDSRVSPELVFDQGIGDVFVIRTAGNVVDSIGIGSIEYAVEHLGTELVVVMGHEKCGAVMAAFGADEYEGGIQVIVDGIRQNLSDTTPEPQTLMSAIDANVSAVVGQLMESEPILKEANDDGHVSIVGARYNISTGVVDILK